MTEYEAFYTFRELVSDSNGLLFNYFSLLSGFLVMTYLVANKINRLLVWMIITLFSVMGMFLILNIYFLNADLTSLGFYIEGKVETGEYDLSWFGNAPSWGNHFVSVLQMVVSIGGFIGCLLYFYTQRRKK